ncbi:hypothetical protein AB6A40_011090 [Gnathostoma spinigerum]|uniref:Uncharacterized protein n=1 Tax=Gnathostoma spinigerum TaxID=75299 RepID=A0ABD6EWV3_9BILA
MAYDTSNNALDECLSSLENLKMEADEKMRMAKAELESYIRSNDALQAEEEEIDLRASTIELIRKCSLNDAEGTEKEGNMRIQSLMDEREATEKEIEAMRSELAAIEKKAGEIRYTQLNYETKQKILLSTIKQYKINRDRLAFVKAEHARLEGLVRRNFKPSQ